MPSVALLAGTAAEIAAYAFLAIQLFRHNLFSSYRWLGCFAIVDALRLAVGVTIPRGTNAYAWFYLATQPLTWLLLALITLEVYGGVLRNHNGLSGLTRKVIPGVLGASMVVSLASLAIQPSTSNRWPVLETFFLLERTIYLSLLAFVLLLGLFLAWYPVRLARNALIHFGVFTAYFGSFVAAWFLRTLGGPALVATANGVHMAGTVLAGLSWAMLLRTGGELATSRTGYINRSPEEEERLLAQLEAINRTLLGPERRQ